MIKILLNPTGTVDFGRRRDRRGLAPRIRRSVVSGVFGRFFFEVDFFSNFIERTGTVDFGGLRDGRDLGPGICAAVLPNVFASLLRKIVLLKKKHGGRRHGGFWPPPGRSRFGTASLRCRA